VIDLRSDTVTRPTPAMRKAMMEAPLGDDVLGDEPTVQRLEAMVSSLLGHEAALYVPSGTMSNQLAIRSVCEPGDEIVAHRDSHIIHYETGAPAALSGCMIRALDGEGGLFLPEDIAPAIRHRDIHAPLSRMLVLENTHNRGGGTVWPVDRFRACCEEARRHGLHVHLDGARLMNAAIASGVPAAAYARHVDTLSICFSKGLGAPVGSALVGPGALIHRARRFRKQFGGGMRQSGLLAAACIHALEHHVERLAEDHANARRLARGLDGIAGIRLQFAPESTPSNMVFFFVDAARGTAQALCDRLRGAQVLMIPMDPQRVRAVLHLDVSAAQVDEAIAAVRAALA
jgi:threonine aldolase